jgi:hypothetical protein
MKMASTTQMFKKVSRNEQFDNEIGLERLFFSAMKYLRSLNKANSQIWKG